MLTNETETEFVLFLRKFCLAHRLRQLTRDVKSDVRTLNFKSGVTYAPPRKTSTVVMRRKMSKIKETANNK